MMPGFFSAVHVPEKKPGIIPGSARTVSVDVSDFPFAVILTR